MAMSRQLGFSPGETDTDAPASHFSRQQQQQMMAAMKGSSSSSMSSTAAHEPFVARSDSRLHDAAARGVRARARVCVCACVCVRVQVGMWVCAFKRPSKGLLRICFIIGCFLLRVPFLLSPPPCSDAPHEIFELLHKVGDSRSNKLALITDVHGCTTTERGGERERERHTHTHTANTLLFPHSPICRHVTAEWISSGPQRSQRSTSRLTTTTTTTTMTMTMVAVVAVVVATAARVPALARLVACLAFARRRCDPPVGYSPARAAGAAAGARAAGAAAEHAPLQRRRARLCSATPNRAACLPPRTALMV